MKEWTQYGWEYTDSNRPFGHGDQTSDVGATYVLRPYGRAIKGMLPMTLLAIINHGYDAANPNQRTQRSEQKATDGIRNATSRRELEVARTRDRHPLSCVIKITTNALRESESYRLLIVEQEVGADFQVLSQFRLLAVSQTSTIEAEDPNPPQFKRGLGSFSYGRLLDAR